MGCVSSDEITAYNTDQNVLRTNPSLLTRESQPELISEPETAADVQVGRRKSNFSSFLPHSQFKCVCVSVDESR